MTTEALADGEASRQPAWRGVIILQTITEALADGEASRQPA
jgi:hypothetical protein